MRNFNIASQEHYILTCCSKTAYDDSEAMWNVLTQQKVSDGRSSDLADTIPAEYAALLMTDEFAATFAMEALFAAYVSGNISPGIALREKFRQAWKSFIDQVKQQDQIECGLGWDKSSSWKSFREISKSEVDSKQILRIAKLAGRMYADLKGTHSAKVLGIPAAVVSITQGSSIQKLIPAELSLLSNPDTENLLLYRLATQKATIYQTEGIQQKAGGPIVICIDNSCSMKNSSRGFSREEWAAAAAIAVSRIARENKREVAVIHFTTSVVIQDLNPNCPADIIKLITTQLQGGTDCAVALRAAKNKCQQMQKKAKKFADVIFITDGIDYSPELPAAVFDL